MKFLFSNLVFFLLAGASIVQPGEAVVDTALTCPDETMTTPIMGAASMCTIFQMADAATNNMEKIDLTHGSVTGAHGHVCMNTGSKLQMSGNQMISGNLYVEDDTRVDIPDDADVKGQTMLNYELTEAKAAVTAFKSEIENEVTMPCTTSYTKEDWDAILDDGNLNTILNRIATPEVICLEGDTKIDKDLVIHGDGKHPIYFKIGGKFHFKSKITTTGGLNDCQIIWYIKGDADTEIPVSSSGGGGGSDLKHKAYLPGTIINLYGKVHLSPGRVTCGVISNHDINLSSGSLVGCDTPFPTPENGGATGDPHFKSWLGEKFDYHGACDLVLVHSSSFDNGKGLDLHIRTKHRRQWSYISSAAFRIGDEIFEVNGGLDHVHHLNGESNVQLPAKISGHKITYKKESEKKHTYLIQLGDNNRVMIRVVRDWLAVMVKGATTEHFGDSVGIMGNFATGAKLGRDGTTVFDDTDAFGQEWQVLHSEPKLFHTVEGVQHPMKCLPPPPVDIQRRNLRANPKDKAAAKLACAHVDKEDFDNCVFDVLITDDPDMAGGY